MTESFKTPAWSVGVRTMPFQQYAPYFRPEDLEILSAAFDATLLELRTAGVDMSTEQNLALVKKDWRNAS